MCAAVLEGYASRGVFRGFSQGPVRGGKASYKMLWHRDRSFELTLDSNRNTLKFDVVLPQVPEDMYRDLREFVAERCSEQLPQHRRIDAGKARVQCLRRKGDVSLTLTVEDGDYEYGTRRLINLVHEVYLVFLKDGRYYDYLVQTFDLDPDRM